MPLLEARHLSHRFPDGALALNDVSLGFEPHTLSVIAGANGSGKTVFARHLNGLLRPTSGAVLLKGRSIFDDLGQARQAVGLVFQNSESQFVGQTVDEDVAFGPENLNLAPDEVRRRVQRALDAVGLLDLRHANPHDLSGGQKRRVAIAGILAMEPQVIVFDEPFSGLDYRGICQVLYHIVQLAQRDVAVIVISHQLETLLAHADRLILFCEGTVVADDAPKAVCPLLETYGVRNPLRKGVEIEELSWLTSSDR